jgi:hypothetical protein
MGVTVIGGSSAEASTATLGSYTKTPISSARTEISYSNIAFSSASTNILSGMQSFAFSDDGDYLVLVNNANDVYFHSLSTPWDISTATNTVNDFNVVGLTSPFYVQIQGSPSQGGNEAGLYINNNSTDQIIYYPFSTYFAALDDVNRVEFDYSSIATNIIGFEFFNNGTKLLLAAPASSNSTAWVVPLSTAWDISTANAAAATAYSLPSTSVYSISFEETGLWAIASKLDQDSIQLWSLTTAYDLSTATLEDNYTNATYGENYTLAWNRDTYDKFYGYNYADGDDITTFTLNRSVSNKPDSYQVCTLDLSSGNTFVLDDIYDYQSTLIQTENNPDSNSVKSYKVMLPYAANASANTELYDFYERENVLRSNIDGGTATTASMFFADDGKKFLLGNYEPNADYRVYELDDPYDIAGYFSKYPNPTASSSIWRLGVLNNQLYYISNDGSFAFSRDFINLTMNKISFGSPFSSEGIVTETFSPTGAIGSNGAPFVSRDGKYLYVANTNGVDNYIMSRPFDLTTATLHTSTSQVSVTGGEPQVTQKGDVLMFTIASPNQGQGGFYAATMTTPHDLTTISTESLIKDEPYSRHMYLYKDDQRFLTYDYQSSGNYRVLSFAVNRSCPKLVLPSSILPEQDLDLTLEQGKTVEFNLLTTDGGSTFIAHKGA